MTPEDRTLIQRLMGYTPDDPYIPLTERSSHWTSWFRDQLAGIEESTTDRDEREWRFYNALLRNASQATIEVSQHGWFSI